MIGAVSIALGYVWLLWTTGWMGLAFMAVHIGAMLLCMPKGK